MKRFLLITAGTVGGLGAVLSVTPPQFGDSATSVGNDLAILPAADKTAQTPAVAQSATPAATKAATSAKSNSTKPATTTTPVAEASVTPPTPTPSKATTPTPTPTPTVKSVSGNFAGTVVNTRYGNVQVEISVTNGKIVDVKVLMAPSGKNDRWTNFAVPVLKQQTLAAQSTDIQGASGASYTTYGWRLSLQGAMAKAGL